MENPAHLGLLLGTAGALLLSLESILGEKLISTLNNYLKNVQHKFMAVPKSAFKSKIANIKLAFQKIKKDAESNPLTRDIYIKYGFLFLIFYAFFKASFRVKIGAFLIFVALLVILTPIIMFFSILMFIKASYNIYELTGIHVVRAGGFILLVIGFVLQYLSIPA